MAGIDKHIAFEEFMARRYKPYATVLWLCTMADAENPKRISGQSVRKYLRIYQALGWVKTRRAGFTQIVLGWEPKEAQG